MLILTNGLHGQAVTREEFFQQRMLEIEGKKRAFVKSFPTTAQLAKSQAAQENFDVTYYRLELNIDPVAQRLSGAVTVHASSLTTELAEMILDLDQNMTVGSVSGDASSFTHQNNRLTLALNRKFSPGESIIAIIKYEGRPQPEGFGGFVFDNQDSEHLIWTLSEPYYARVWWPCKDAPNDKADSVDVTATVPANLIVASNGKLVEQRTNADGTTTFHWQERHPITTYLVSLAITNYATFSHWFHYSSRDSMEVRYYVYPSRLEQARQELEDTVDMIRFFHETYGPYPFLNEKYGIAQFGWGGGMEHQTITSQGSFGNSLTVHELAHQWWGDMITNASWGDIWLNEGFASYSEALYFEHAVGREYYHEYMGFMDHNYQGSIFRSDTTSAGSIFNIIVYHKGAWVLHMLRHIVGDSTFFNILRTYADDPRFKYGNTTTARFQQLCETIYGTDLDWFFEPWIYGTGRPFYRYRWTAIDSAGATFVRLHLEQAQVAEDQLFAMPMEVFVQFAEGDTTVQIFNDKTTQDYAFAVHAEPVAVVLDEQRWILKRVEEAGAGPPSKYALRQNYPNPFNGETTIAFDLPQHEDVELRIYSVTGELVRVLASRRFFAGEHRVHWDGNDERGERAGSGIYFYRLTAGRFSETKRLVLLK